MNSDLVMGYGTFPNEAVASSICEALVAEGLIACANILPAHQAIYQWQGVLHKEAEVGAWIKTSARRKPAVLQRFKELHPYQTPCLVFLDISDGLPDFLRWVYGQSL